MYKYKAKAKKWSKTVEKVDIVRETPKKVVIQLSNGREAFENKDSDYASYRDSFEEAKSVLVAEATREVVELELQLDKSKERLDAVTKLEEQA